MKESEMKTKWCPKAANSKSLVAMTAALSTMHSGEDTLKKVLSATNEILDNVEKCIGSDCALWEWDDNGCNDAVRNRHKNGEGHCGLRND